MKIARILWRWFYRIMLVFIGLFIILAIWFYLAVRIDPPKPSSEAVLKLERKEISKDFYTLDNNWLKKSETGLWEIYVEGDGFERGVIEGKLHKELAEKQEIAFTDQIQKLIPSRWMLNYLKYFIAFFNRNLDEYVCEEYQLEIYGESLYASDKFDFIAPKYHRMLNYHAAHDIGHALQDKNMAVGCTSFGAWGYRTSDSTLLIGRNFDFYAGDAFAEDKLVNFVNPAKGYKFMMVSWAGMIGTVSGMNMKGLTVTINASKSEIPSSAATPISLVAREILQYAKNIDEAYAIAKKRKVFVSESILIGSVADKRTAIIEITPSVTELFESPVPGSIICSNHYQGSIFKNDAINNDNIQNSSSLYRYKRMTQLLERHHSLSVKDAASILRNKEGLDDKDIGLGNEKSLNQLIAHHSVIFKPEALQVWVSTNPYQLGPYICYDLTKVFAEAPGLNTKKELYEKDLCIAADSFLYTSAFKNYNQYKLLRERIKKASSEEGQTIKINDIEEFAYGNPEYFETWFTLGNYYASKNDTAKALKCYKLALTKEVTTVPEKNSIQEKINTISNN